MASQAREIRAGSHRSVTCFYLLHSARQQGAQAYPHIRALSQSCYYSGLVAICKAAEVYKYSFECRTGSQIADQVDLAGYVSRSIEDWMVMTSGTISAFPASTREGGFAACMQGQNWAELIHCIIQLLY